MESEDEIHRVKTYLNYTPLKNQNPSSTILSTKGWEKEKKRDLDII